MQTWFQRLIDVSSVASTEASLKEAAKQAIDQYGVGSGASRLVCGTLAPHMRLEERLAEFKRTEAALQENADLATLEAEVGTAITQAGSLGAMLQRCSEAVALFRAILERNPAKRDAHYYLSGCYAKLGDAAAAARESALFNAKP